MEYGTLKRLVVDLPPDFANQTRIARNSARPSAFLESSKLTNPTVSRILQSPNTNFQSTKSTVFRLGTNHTYFTDVLFLIIND